MTKKAVRSSFWFGVRAILPVMTGMIPFGAVMGIVSADAHLSLLQTILMNVFVFAGASQLAALDLLSRHTALVAVIVTGLVINLRFLLYSAAMAPILKKSRLLSKLVCAYTLTDQSYGTLSAHENKLSGDSEKIRFYFGAATTMVGVWQASVVAGFIFGNFAPPTLSLDFAVPLSFLALTMPTLRSPRYLMVAIFSMVVSILLNPLPFKLGLILTALLSIGFAIVLLRRRTLA